MKALEDSDFVIVRHAPVATPGRLFGRTDVAAALPDPGSVGGLIRFLSPAKTRVSSPALRCRQTANLVWPDAKPTLDETLWEQDFGSWEGVPYTELPDIGDLPSAELSRHRAEGGESFADVCDRVVPALTQWARSDGPVVVVAHAGVVRAALTVALGSVPAALAFEVDNLSVTRFRRLGAGRLSIRAVNVVL
ncbi:MAG: histidine phosphatase family protein [Pseudomonadota bacterium]